MLANLPWIPVRKCMGHYVWVCTYPHWVCTVHVCLYVCAHVYTGCVCVCVSMLMSDSEPGTTDPVRKYPSLWPRSTCSLSSEPTQALSQKYILINTSDGHTVTLGKYFAWFYSNVSARLGDKVHHLMKRFRRQCYHRSKTSRVRSALYLLQLTCAMPDPMSPPPITVTCFMALEMEELVENLRQNTCDMCAIVACSGCPQSSSRSSLA